MLPSQIEQAHLSGASNILDSLGIAAILLNSIAVVTGINVRAEGFLGAELQIKHHKIAIADRRAAKQVAHAIDAALFPFSGTYGCGPIAVPRRGKRPLLIYVVGLQGNDIASAHAIVLINDLDQHSAVPVEHLIRLFGLTPAEAKLASRLSKGISLASASEELQISLETARNQLKAIFQRPTQISRASWLPYCRERCDRLRNSTHL